MYGESGRDQECDHGNQSPRHSCECCPQRSPQQCGENKVLTEMPKLPQGEVDGDLDGQINRVVADLVPGRAEVVT